MLSDFDDFGIDKRTYILNDINGSGDIPEDLSRLIFIMQPKKSDVNGYERHQKISIMSNMKKHMIRIRKGRELDRT